MLHSFVLIFLIALPTAFSLPLTEYDQPANLEEQLRSDALPYSMKTKFPFKVMPMDEMVPFGQVTARNQYSNKREKENQEKLNLKLLERILKEGNIRRTVLDGKEFFG